LYNVFKVEVLSIFGSSANSVVFLAGGGGLDVLRDKRQGVFLSGAGAFEALTG
jgi:hypothetical protein